MALSLFRFIAALGRTQVVANTLGTFTLLMVFVLGGFIVAKSKHHHTLCMLLCYVYFLFLEFFLRRYCLLFCC